MNETNKHKAEHARECLEEGWELYADIAKKYGVTMARVHYLGKMYARQAKKINGLRAMKLTPVIIAGLQKEKKPRKKRARKKKESERGLKRGVIVDWWRWVRSEPHAPTLWTITEPK